MMATLQKICAGLPLDHMPPKLTQRNDSVPHAPIRTPNLSDSEEMVIVFFLFK